MERNQVVDHPEPQPDRQHTKRPFWYLLREANELHSSGIFRPQLRNIGSDSD